MTNKPKRVRIESSTEQTPKEAATEAQPRPNPLGQPSREASRVLRDFYGLTSLEDIDLTAASEALHHCSEAALKGGHVGLWQLLNRFTLTVLWEAAARGLLVHPTTESVQEALDSIGRSTQP